MKQTDKVVFFAETAKGEKEGLDVLCTGKDDKEWVGRTVVVTDDDGDSIRYSFYVFPQDESSALLFCPFGVSPWLTQFVSSMDKYNVDAAQKAWPLLMAALKNGFDDNYSHSEVPALIHVGDVPTGESDIWGIAVKIENVDFENMDTAYVFKKAVWASNYAVNMLTEYQKNDISAVDAAKSGIKKGFDAWRTARMIGKVATLVLPILGIDILGGDES